MTLQAIIKSTGKSGKQGLFIGRPGLLLVQVKIFTHAENDGRLFKLEKYQNDKAEVTPWQREAVLTKMEWPEFFFLLISSSKSNNASGGNPPIPGPSC